MIFNIKFLFYFSSLNCRMGVNRNKQEGKIRNRNKKSLFLMFFWIASCLAMTIGSFVNAESDTILKSKSEYATVLSENILDAKFKKVLEDWRKWIVNNYCEFVLEHSLLIQQEWTMIYYDASQSSFLYFLCNHVWDFKKDFSKTVTDNLKKRNLKSFHLICKSRADGIRQPEWCIPWCESSDPKMLGCDFSMLIPKVIKPVLNDISNAWLVLAYGMIDDKKDISTLTDDIAFRYFDFPLYNSKFTEYPRTRDTAKNFLKKIRKVIKKTEVIDFEKIMKLWRSKSAQECDKIPIFTWMLEWNSNKIYNMLECSFNDQLVISQKKPILEWIVDMMQNEMFYYQLFVDYYSHVLKNNLNLIPYVLTEKPVKELNKAAEEASKIKTDSILVHKAMDTTIRSLTNAQATFWIHIWLSMYYEEAIKFRNALAKIYTPIHQFYYKLRNVQQEK